MKKNKRQNEMNCTLSFHKEIVNGPLICKPQCTKKEKKENPCLQKLQLCFIIVFSFNDFLLSPQPIWFKLVNLCRRRNFSCSAWSSYVSVISLSEPALEPHLNSPDERCVSLFTANSPSLHLFIKCFFMFHALSHSNFQYFACCSKMVTKKFYNL